MMDRRVFLGTVAFLAGPRAADAQATTRVHRVGFVTLNPASGNSGPTLAGLRQGLKDLGYHEGRNLIIESRFADGRREVLPLLLKELLALGVHVLVTLGTPATVAGCESTSGPIVFIGVGNPVGSGFAASLAPREGISPVSRSWALRWPRKVLNFSRRLRLECRAWLFYKSWKLIRH